MSGLCVYMCEARLAQVYRSLNNGAALYGVGLHPKLISIMALTTTSTSAVHPQGPPPVREPSGTSDPLTKIPQASPGGMYQVISAVEPASTDIGSTAPDGLPVRVRPSTSI